MSSVFYDPTFFEHENSVGMPYRGEPMGDDDGRPVPRNTFNGTLEGRLRFVINRRCCFIKHQ